KLAVCLLADEGAIAPAGGHATWRQQQKGAEGAEQRSADDDPPEASGEGQSEELRAHLEQVLDNEDRQSDDNRKHQDTTYILTKPLHVQPHSRGVRRTGGTSFAPQGGVPLD